MKDRILKLFGSMTAVAFAALLFTSPAALRAQTIAYDSILQAGNQNFPYNLGMDFKVISPIIVTSLGAFDSNGAPFTGFIKVAIFNQASTALPVAGPLVFHGAAASGTLINGDRFLKLPTPVTLAAGTYSVVAFGYSTSDLSGNLGFAPPPTITPSTENSAGGSISFVGSARYDMNAALDFPTTLDTGPANRYLAGTFQFLATSGEADTFTAGPDKTADTNPEAIVVNPFNTTHLGLAIANWGSGDVSIFEGNGDGTFMAHSPTKNYKVGNNPHAIVAGNFGNGTTDLAVANYADGTVSILIGDGSGGFTIPAVPAYNAGPNPYSIATGDFNKDGNLDLIVANDNQAVTVLLGNGNGTFQGPMTFVDPHIAPSSLAVADFNGDGCLDVAVANPSLGTVSVLLGNGVAPCPIGTPGTFQPAVSLPPDSLPRPYFIATGDFNEDGIPDAAVTDSSGVVFILTGTGMSSPVFNPPSPAAGYPVGMVPTSLAVGDINGDGHLDLLVANTDSNSVSVLAGDGTGNFRSMVSYTTSTMAAPVSVGLGIFNEAANKMDAAVADFDSGPVNILLGQEFTITMASGNDQIALTPVAPFPNPLVATVKNSAMVAQKGVPVTFFAPGSGPSATFAGGTNSVTVLTDASGNATSPAFTANGLPGSYPITATIGYAANPLIDPKGTTTFTETNGGSNTSVVSVTPHSGSGAGPQVFTAVYSDTAGASDLQAVYLDFGSVGFAAHNCIVVYVQASNSLYLFNDINSTGLGPVTLGGGGSVSNSQCTLFGGSTAATPSGNTLSVPFTIQFLPGYGGLKQIFALAQNYAGIQSNGGVPNDEGTWEPATTTPSAVSVNPNSGGALGPQVFTGVFSDTGGVSDLQVVYLSFGSSFLGANGCNVGYEPGNFMLFLFSDNNSTYSTVGEGAGGSVSNSQCTLSGGTLGAMSSGNSLSVPFTITFKSVTSPQTIFGLAQTYDGTQSAITTLGTWTP
jgi:VCBS repeat protein